jgi:hypothetical protein
MEGSTVLEAPGPEGQLGTEHLTGDPIATVRPP